MEFLTSLFETQSNLGSMFQIGLDIVILVMLTMLMAGRRQKIAKADESVIESFEKIIEETASISKEFGTNLEQRQELIQTITARLDQRIQEAQDLCARMERLAQTSAENLRALSAAPSPVIGRHSGKGDHQKVLFLANKGLNSSEIAKSLKKPLGEVELILNLQKIAS